MMFKVFLGEESASKAGPKELANMRSTDQVGNEQDRHLIGWLAILLAFLTACTALPRLPPANSHEAGWVIQSGQAVWRLGEGKSDIAGEVLFATNLAQQRTFVQFSKPPF